MKGIIFYLNLITTLFIFSYQLTLSAADIPVPSEKAKKDKSTVAPVKPYSSSKFHKFYISKKNYNKLGVPLNKFVSKKIEYRDRYLLIISQRDLKSIPKNLLGLLNNNDKMNQVKIWGIVIDTTLGKYKPPADLSAKPRTDAPSLHLVQFYGPAKQEWLSQLQKETRVVRYVGGNAYLVWTRTLSIAKLAKNSSVSEYIQWTSPFHPVFKIDNKINLLSQDIIKVDIKFVDNKDYPSSLNRGFIKKLAGNIFAREKNRNNISRIRVSIPANKLKEVARLPEVINIVRYHSPSLGGEKQGQIVSNNLVSDTTIETPSLVCTGGTGTCPNPPGTCSGTCERTGYFDWLTSSPRSFNFSQFSNVSNPDFFVVDFGDTGIDLGSTAAASLHDGFEEDLGNSRLHYVQHMGCSGTDTCTGGTGTCPVPPGTCTGSCGTISCSFDTSEGLNTASDPNDDNSDPNNHGTHVAAIIAGYYNDFDIGSIDPVHEDPTGYYYGMGIAPFVHIGSTRVFDATGPGSNVAVYNDNTSLADWFNSAYSNNARISSNSWGNKSLPSGTYDSFSEQIDAFVRDASYSIMNNQEMNMVFLAGNTSTTLWAQGSTAKNAIVVGGNENIDNLAGGCLSEPSAGRSNNAMDIADFSGIGPTNDSRFKPDLVAPATRVIGVRTSTWDTALTGETTTDDYLGSCTAINTVDNLPMGTAPSVPAGSTAAPNYIRSSGTSLATPAVAGASALVRQWFINKKNSGNATEANLVAPSPAMTKAWLLNTTTYMTGNRANDDLPSATQGMGRLNLDRSLDTTPRLVRDQLTILDAGDGTYTIQGKTGASAGPLRITLAWTDAPASPGDSVTLKNNLDLELEISGQTYLGNAFLKDISVAVGDSCSANGTHYTGVQHITCSSSAVTSIDICPQDGVGSGASADCRNNVESIWLPSVPANTDFAINVIPTSITSDGVPGVGIATDQDFALVIYNGAINITNKSFTVNKGATHALAPEDLSISDIGVNNSSIQAIIQSVPSGGTLRNGATVLSSNDTFTLQDIIDGNIAYQHDNSNNAFDSFTFIITDGYGATSGGIETFNITVNQPPELDLQTPTDFDVTVPDTASFAIGVLQGETSPQNAVGADLELRDDSTINMVEIGLTGIPSGVINETISVDLTEAGNQNITVTGNGTTSINLQRSASQTEDLSPANYQAVLRTLTYQNTNSPTFIAGTRSITFTATDSMGLTNIPTPVQTAIYIDRNNVDIAFVLDVSGSMSGTPAGSGTPSKLDMLKDAVNMTITTFSGHNIDENPSPAITGPRDKLGVISFNSSVSTVRTLSDFTDSDAETTPMSTLLTNIDNLNHGGSTAMGGGLKKALDDLNALTDAANNQHVILFTDGMQNCNPMVNLVIPASDPGNSDGINKHDISDTGGGGRFGGLPGFPGFPGFFGCASGITGAPDTLLEQYGPTVHTIGTGVSDTSTWKTLLNDIATQTGGAEHSFANETELGSNLNNFYMNTLVSILSQSSLEMVAHKKGTFKRIGNIKRHKFTLNDASHKASFVMSWNPTRKRDLVSIALIAPDGTEITEKTEGVKFIKDVFYTTIHMDLRRMKSANNIKTGGEWQALFVPVSTTRPTLIAPPNRSATSAPSLHLPTRRLAYEYWVLEDDLLIKDEIKPDRRRYLVGEDILVTARVRDGLRVSKGMKVTANIRYPETAISNLLSATDVKVDLKNSGKQTDIRHPVDIKASKLLENAEIVKKLQPATASVLLNDNGKNGDKVANDGIYSGLFSKTDRPGNYSFNINVEGKLPVNGRLMRTRSFEVDVYTGKFSIENSRLTVQRIDRNDANISVTIRPVDNRGNYLGPGHADKLDFNTGKGIFLASPIIDNLDGSYTQDLRVDNLFGDTIRIKILDTEFTAETGPDPKFYWLLALLILLLVAIAIYVYKRR